MKRLLVVAMAALMAGDMFAAPKEKLEAVAKGYPAWSGLTAKNLLHGRRRDPSDLRQRAVVIVEFDGAKVKEQLSTAINFFSLDCLLPSAGEGVGMEKAEWPHGTIVVFVNRGKKLIAENFKKDVLGPIQKANAKSATKISDFTSVYDSVTFADAPKNEGKFPFFYVLGLEGDVIAKGVADKTGYAATRKAIATDQKAVETKKGSALVWKQYYGYVSEPQFFKDKMAKALAAHKPLKPLMTELSKSVTSGDEAKAKEAQMLYDALVQTRNDLVARIDHEALLYPHRANYDIAILSKYWPTAKKDIDPKSIGYIAKNSDAPVLSKAFIAAMTMGSPDFTCKNASEVKKNIAELNKQKKAIAAIKDNPGNVNNQNAALTIDVMLDEAISTMPTKVVQK